MRDRGEIFFFLTTIMQLDAEKIKNEKNEEKLLIAANYYYRTSFSDANLLDRIPPGLRLGYV